MIESDLTIRESIIKSVLSDILSGRLSPGDKLPSEREIAGTHGVSRSIVHLAFEELSHAGFVEVRPRSGNYVADFINNGNFSTLDMLSKVDAGIYTQAYRESMVELRNVLEGFALCTISCNNLKEDFDILDEKMEILKSAAENESDIPFIANELKNFHMEIMRLGGNFISIMVMNSFYYNSSPLWERCVSFWGVETTLKQSEKILCLLKEGKGQECSNLITEMFSRYKEANAV